MTEQELLLTSVLGCRRIDLFVDQRPFTGDQEHRFEQMQRRRAEGEPLQYIIGHCDFMGIGLLVDQRVLIPRQETEILVDFALQKAKLLCHAQSLKILDIGTGSGNIAITLAKNLPGCQVTAIDISKEAIELARDNAQTNFVAHKINFVHDDMVSFLKKEIDEKDKFDFIISNPPYIESLQIDQLPREVQREPRLALDGGKDGLDFYRPIIENSYRFLTAEGFLILEIGDRQSAAIAQIFNRFPQFPDVCFLKDYADTDRIACAQFKDKWQQAAGDSLSSLSWKN